MLKEYCTHALFHLHIILDTGFHFGSAIPLRHCTIFKYKHIDTFLAPFSTVSIVTLACPIQITAFRSAFAVAAMGALLPPHTDRTTLLTLGTASSGGALCTRPCTRIATKSAPTRAILCTVLAVRAKWTF